MRIKINETWESWCERVHTHEITLAQRKISHGMDTDQVLSEMAQNLTKKLMHPILISLRESVKKSYDSTESLQSYWKNYPGYTRQ